VVLLERLGHVPRSLRIALRCSGVMSLGLSWCAPLTRMAPCTPS